MTVMTQARPSAMDIAGTRVDDKKTMIEALEAAGLAGWNVQKLPMWADARAYEGGVSLLSTSVGIKDETTFKTAGVINGRLKLLGTVGAQYKPVQNEQHAEFLDEVVGQSGGHYAQATAFKGGRLIYISIELPDYVKVGGVDPVKMYLNGINSHDGSTHFMLNLSPERAWCANQLGYFRRNSLKFRHSGNISDKVVQAQESLGLTFDLIKEFEQDAERLVHADMNWRQFGEVVEKVFPPPEKYYEDRTSTTRGEANRNTRYANLRDGMDEMLALPHNAEIRNTAWGGLNAVIEFLEWGHGSDTNREERIMTSDSLEKKIVKARNAFSEFALTA